MYIIFFWGCDNVQPDTMLLTLQRNILASSLLLSQEGGSKFNRNFFYSTVHGFWPVKVLAELAVGPTGCGEVARLGFKKKWYQTPGWCMSRSSRITNFPHFTPALPN